MADDLHKRYVDKRFVSFLEPWELVELHKEIRELRPRPTDDQIEGAISLVHRLNPKLHDRDQLKALILENL